MAKIIRKVKEATAVAQIRNWIRFMFKLSSVKEIKFCCDYSLTITFARKYDSTIYVIVSDSDIDYFPSRRNPRTFDECCEYIACRNTAMNMCIDVFVNNNPIVNPFHYRFRLK